MKTDAFTLEVVRTSTTWGEVGYRLACAYEALDWMRSEVNALRADEVFGNKRWTPRPWPPASFRGIDRPLENLAALVSLRRERLAFAKRGQPC